MYVDSLVEVFFPPEVHALLMFSVVGLMGIFAFLIIAPLSYNGPFYKPHDVDYMDIRQVL